MIILNNFDVFWIQTIKLLLTRSQNVFVHFAGSQNYILRDDITNVKKILSRNPYSTSKSIKISTKPTSNRTN